MTSPALYRRQHGWKVAHCRAADGGGALHRRQPTSVHSQIDSTKRVNTRTDIDIDIDTCTYPDTHTHRHTQTHTERVTDTQIHAHTHTHAHTRTRTSTHTCARAHAHIRTHAHTHMHTTTHTQASPYNSANITVYCSSYQGPTSHVALEGASGFEWFPASGFSPHERYRIATTSASCSLLCVGAADFCSWHGSGAVLFLALSVLTNRFKQESHAAQLLPFVGFSTTPHAACTAALHAVGSGPGVGQKLKFPPTPSPRLYAAAVQPACSSRRSLVVFRTQAEHPTNPPAAVSCPHSLRTSAVQFGVGGTGVEFFGVGLTGVAGSCDRSSCPTIVS